MSNKQLRKSTRIAGLAYILIILLGVFKVNFIELSVIKSGNYAPTNNIIADELLFRIGIASEIVMYLLVIALSLALYFILKQIDKNLALSALLLRFGEAIIGSMVTILSGLIPLLILNIEPVFGQEQIRALIELFLNLRIAGLNIVLIFIGSGGTIFCYLFYRSWFVPRLLAAWGIFTYVSMFILGFVNILLPERPNMIEIVLFSLGGLFEVILGFWLLIKGVNIEKWKTFAAEAAD